MRRTKKRLSIVFTFLFTLFTLLSNMPAQAAEKKTVVPEVQFASAPVTEYTAGDRVQFNINSPNFGGKVEYRVALWDDSQKSYSDLWNEKNGYPNRYYTKWQPTGNTVFTLGWPIIKPGNYRITVYAKRVGIASSKAALAGMNCDSYKQSVAFTVKPKMTLLDKAGQAYGSGDANKLETYKGDTKIAANNIALSNAKVEGDLYISGDNASIKNVSVTGKIVIDPGKDGSATLENVIAKNIEVLSGGQNSIHIKNVQADTMDVSSSTPIRIEADGDTEIVSTSATGYVIFDRKSGTYGTITITEGSDGVPVIEFRGDIQDKVEVETTATIKTGEDSRISNLVIATEKATDTVKLEGQYDKVEIAKEAKVEIGQTAVITDSLKVIAKAEIKADEKAEIKKVDIATATNETVKLEGTFEKVEINSEAKVEVAANTNIGSIVANTNAEINLDKTAVVDNIDKGSSTVVVGGEGQVGPSTPPATGGDVPPAVAVSAVTAAGVGNASTITTDNGTLQMSASIEPANATNKNVTWSVTNGTGSATISGGGLLTAVSDGTVTVKATAQDGSGKYGEKEITISNQLAPIIATVSTIANGAVNPDVVVTLVNDTFTADGVSTLPANWTGSLGTTGLAGSTITRNSNTQITFHLAGTAKAGTLTLKANGAAITSGTGSNTITVTVPGAKGTIERATGINGGEKATAAINGQNVTFDGEIAYYKSNEINKLPKSANWVGVKITAPVGVTPDENAILTVNGINCNIDGNPGWSNITEAGDGPNYFYLYQRILNTANSYEIVIKWNNDVTETYHINFAPTATLGVYKTDLANMISGAQFNHDNGAKYGDISQDAINALGTAIETAQTVYDNAVNTTTDAVQAGIYAAQDELIAAMDAFFDAYNTTIEAVSDNMTANKTYADINPLIIKLSINNGIGDFVTGNTDYITLGGDFSKMVIKKPIVFELNQNGKAIGATLELTGSIGSATTGAISIAAGGVNGHSHGFDIVFDAPVISTTSAVAEGAVNSDIVVNLANNTFKEDGISNSINNWIVDLGTTGLQVDSITRESATQVTFHLTGTAKPGKLTLKANAAALTSGVESNTLTIIVLVAAPGAKGTIVRSEFTNGGINAIATIDSQDTHRITFSGEIAFYKTGEGINTLPIPGNWVGVKITAPDGVIPDGNAILTVNGKNFNTNEVNGWSNIIEDGDGPNFFHIYQRVRDISKVYQIVIKWNNESAEAYYIDFAPTTTLEVFRTDVTTISVKEGQQEKVAGIRDDDDMKRITVWYPLTAGGLKNAIESTNGSTQNYEITDSMDNAKGDDVVLAQADKLIVTSQDGSVSKTYTIRVFGTVTIKVVQADGTTPVPGALISLYNENGDPIYFLDENGNPITEIGLDEDGHGNFFINAANYKYRIKAKGYNTQVGDFSFTLDPNPLIVTATLSTMSNNVVTIRVKDGDQYQQKVNFINENAKYAIIEYPATVGELKSSIESTNGSSQTYGITNSLGTPKVDNELLLADGDIMTVTSADETTKDTYRMCVYDTMTFTVTDGTVSIEGAVINIYYNDELFDLSYVTGGPESGIITDAEGKCVFNVPCTDGTYTYRVTADECEPQVGSFTPGQLDSDVVEVSLPPMQTNVTTIGIKQGHEAEVADISDDAGTKLVTVVYPLKVGELMSAIESTNGSTQSYAVTGKGDTDTLAAGDILTVTSKDGTASETYTIRVYVTVTIKAVQEDGTTPVSGAILNLSDGENPIQIEDEQGNLTPDIALNGQGEVTLWFVPATYPYSIGAEGYNTVSGDFTFTLNDNLSTVAVTLSPAVPKEITSTKVIDDIAVLTGSGKILDQIKADLGNTVIMMVGTEEVSVPVIWSSDTTPAYNNAAVGTYVLTGTIGQIPAGYIDATDTIATINVNIVVADVSTALSSIGAIVGTAQVGTELRPGLVLPLEAVYSFQWQICNEVDGIYADIVEATTNIYTPVAGDVGKYIKVKATGAVSQSGISYSGTVTSDPVGPVAAATTAAIVTIYDDLVNAAASATITDVVIVGDITVPTKGTNSWTIDMSSKTITINPGKILTLAPNSSMAFGTMINNGSIIIQGSVNDGSKGYLQGGEILGSGMVSGTGDVSINVNSEAALRNALRFEPAYIDVSIMSPLLIATDLDLAKESINVPSRRIHFYGTGVLAGTTDGISFKVYSGDLLSQHGNTNNFYYSDATTKIAEGFFAPENHTFIWNSSIQGWVSDI